MKKKLYIETSVWNQLEHTDRPDWREAATLFIDTLKTGYYEPFVSAVVLDEIGATPDENTRKKLLKHIDSVKPEIIDFDEEAVALTEKYMAAPFIQSDSLKVYNDCCHVAIATVNGIRHISKF